MIENSILQAMQSDKVLIGAPVWSSDGAFTSSRLALEVHGVGVSGLFLRIKIANSVDGFTSLFQTEWDARGSTVHLERLDFGISHTNPNKGPKEFRLMQIDETHLHDFKLNYLQVENRMIERNLPIARRLEVVPKDIDEFFAIGEIELKIKGLSRISRPPFQSSFL